MIEFVNERINHMRRPFRIKEDGSSQTRLSNNGRVGFYAERVCGIDPNSDQRPDLGDWELKTCQGGKKVTIGTMSESEWKNIKTSPVLKFEKSAPYVKMKNTIFVVYEKLSDNNNPQYIVRGTATCQLSALSAVVKQELQSDYEYICQIIRQRTKSRDNLTAYLQNNGSISGMYLSLTYKGQGSCGYNYPAWNFTAAFMKKILSDH